MYCVEMTVAVCLPDTSHVCYSSVHANLNVGFYSQ